MGLQLFNSSPDKGAFYFTTGVCSGRSPTDCSMESVGIVTFDHGKSGEFEFLNN